MVVSHLQHDMVSYALANLVCPSCLLLLLTEIAVKRCLETVPQCGPGFEFSVRLTWHIVGPTPQGTPIFHSKGGYGHVLKAVFLSIAFATLVTPFHVFSTFSYCTSAPLQAAHGPSLDHEIDSTTPRICSPSYDALAIPPDEGILAWLPGEI